MAVHSETAVAANRTEALGVRRVLGLDNLPLAAAAYLAGVVLVAALVSLAVLVRISPDTEGWGTFALLLALASVAQLFIVEKPGGQSYRTAIVFHHRRGDSPACAVRRPDQHPPLRPELVPLQAQEHRARVQRG